MPVTDNIIRREVLKRIRDDATLWADLWPLTDAYGPHGFIPPQGYDWSGFRDSSDEAITAMATKMGLQTTITWVMFTKRTEDPKLGWIEQRLDTLGIPHRRNGSSAHAPILEVAGDREAEAWTVLDQRLRNGRRIDDVRDDHPMFLQPFKP